LKASSIWSINVKEQGEERKKEGTKERKEEGRNGGKNKKAEK
jgi:hypothetical protein